MMHVPSPMTRPRPAVESCFTPEKLDEIAAVLAEVFRGADARTQAEAVEDFAEAA